ncbi:MAG: DUF362 domain-containing protein [Verrucomicrobia bacterium]|nr:DUF362 domain-containing protein [Verrucomicrobiota bacterium]
MTKKTAKEPSPKRKTKPKASEVLFAPVGYELAEAGQTLPARFERLLDRLDFGAAVKDKRVAVKMHLGGGVGYTTIHPLFVRILIRKIKEAGGRPFVTDLGYDVASAVSRGYTQEVIGAPLVPATGQGDKYFYAKKVSLKTLKEIRIAGEIHDADVLINLSHTKGHGACGYGGACKNIAMGCVTGQTRGAIHALEGGMTWNAEICTHCEACIRACRYNANRFTKDGEYRVFYHNCVYCMHCVAACPVEAITLDPGGFKTFQEGMALATDVVLKTFNPGAVFHINVLLQVTYLCDCWGFSTPALVPDVGILASRDMVAIEKASLDLLDADDVLPNSLPKGRELGKKGHLFERIHQKDPFVQLRALERRGLGTQRYTLVEVK